VAFLASQPANQVEAAGIGGTISTLAGTGGESFSGDGAPARAATFNEAYDVGVDASGNMYVADFFNCRVRKVSGGIISTIAGTGTCGYNGDGIAATSAQLNYPYGLGVAPNGDIYIADSSNHRVRRIDVSTGLISTVAGTGASGAANGDGAATQRNVHPYDVAFFGDDFYIADGPNCRIRKVNIDADPSLGQMLTVVGPAVSGYACGNYDSTVAGFDVTASDGRIGKLAGGTGVTAIAGLDFDAAGNMYIGDFVGCRVRKVTVDGDGFNRSASGERIETIFDNVNASGFCPHSRLVYSVAVHAGFVYASLLTECAIMRIPTTPPHTATVFAGVKGTCAMDANSNDIYSDAEVGDELSPTGAPRLVEPFGIDVDPYGDVLVADAYRVRVVYATDADEDGYVTERELAIGESDTSKCLIMLADLNYDGAVSNADLQMIASAVDFGSVPNKPRRYDQNGNNQVNVIDLQQISARIGQSVSAC
jgi:hypothetical protein